MRRMEEPIRDSERMKKEPKIETREQRYPSFSGVAMLPSPI
jgi:hypothetical protein